MKLIQIITHPATLIICFLFILISGEASGGFYVMYILIGLPHGVIHSILALLAILTILFSVVRYKRNYSVLAEPVLNIIGLLLMLLSLFLFFTRDSAHYNYPTFYQLIPVCVLALFGLISVSFLLFNLMKLKLRPTD